MENATNRWRIDMMYVEKYIDNLFSEHDIMLMECTDEYMIESTFTDRVKEAIAKIKAAMIKFFNAIKDKLQDIFTSKRAKEMEEFIKEHPEYANIKISISDMKKIEEFEKQCHASSIMGIKKLKMWNPREFEKFSEECDRIVEEHRANVKKAFAVIAGATTAVGIGIWLKTRRDWKKADEEFEKTATEMQLAYSEDVNKMHSDYDKDVEKMRGDYSRGVEKMRADHSQTVNDMLTKAALRMDQMDAEYIRKAHSLNVAHINNEFEQAKTEINKKRSEK